MSDKSISDEQTRNKQAAWAKDLINWRTPRQKNEEKPNSSGLTWSRQYSGRTPASPRTGLQICPHLGKKRKRMDTVFIFEFLNNRVKFWVSLFSLQQLKFKWVQIAKLLKVQRSYGSKFLPKVNEIVLRKIWILFFLVKHLSLGHWFIP
jgi:hypothetical protein